MPYHITEESVSVSSHRDDNQPFCFYETTTQAVINSTSETLYYLREQAAHLVRSGASASACLTEQRKSLSGKRLVSLVLKRSVSWTQTPSPPLLLSVCHRSPSSKRVSRALIWFAILRRHPLWAAPLWWPGPLVREELPGGQSQDRPLMRTPTLASTSDKQWYFEEPLLYMYSHTHVSSILRWRRKEKWIRAEDRNHPSLTAIRGVLWL